MSSSKTISTTKRLCTAFIPSQASSSTSAAVAVLRRRPRARSASGVISTPSSSTSTAAGPSERRTFYTAATGVSHNPLQFFDVSSSTTTAGPSSPSPGSRPSNAHVLSTQRLPQGESQHANSNSGSGSSHSQHGGGQQGHSSTTNQPLLGSSSFSPAVDLHPSSSPHSDRPYAFHTSNSRYHGALGASSSSVAASSGQSSDGHVAEEPSSSKSTFDHPRRLFQLDVGAYGIPKRGHVSRSLPEAAEFAGLESAVQVGEDAYFVRDDAMGVADGVGGWSSCREKRAPGSPRPRHPSALRGYIRKDVVHEPSPSALFARRLMHFCAVEAAEARNRVQQQLESKFPGTSFSDFRTRKGVLSPSLKHGVIRPLSLSDPQPTRHPNARPFLWPWEEEASLKPSQETSCANDSPLGADEAVDEVSSVDPVEVLERAYTRAIGAHVERVTTPEPTSGTYASPDLRLDHTTPSADDNSREWRPLLSGSSTALLATLSGDRLRIAHLGDCSGLLVRSGDVIWRSEEMWWGFNYPLQLGPSSPTHPQDARTYELRVEADDVLVLASDGMSDNLWEEDVVDEVRRFVGSFTPTSAAPRCSNSQGFEGQNSRRRDAIGRRALAGMLSEALCSRARRVSERCRSVRSQDTPAESSEDLPFSRRAKEEGRSFRGGKCDDISVLVAVITPSTQNKTYDY